MAIKITDEVIKEYTERNGLPEVYEAYKGIKNSKDLKKFMRDTLNKRTVEAIEIEQKRNKKIDFEVIQYLNDLLAEKKIGAATALRKKAKNKNIMSLPPTTLQYLERNFGYSDDETENEEYE